MPKCPTYIWLHYDSNLLHIHIVMTLASIYALQTCKLSATFRDRSLSFTRVIFIVLWPSLILLPLRNNIHETWFFFRCTSPHSYLLRIHLSVTGFLCLLWVSFYSFGSKSGAICLFVGITSSRKTSLLSLKWTSDFVYYVCVLVVLSRTRMWQYGNISTPLRILCSWQSCFEPQVYLMS